MAQGFSYKVNSSGQREDLPFAEPLARSFYNTYLRFGHHCPPPDSQRLLCVCYYVAMRSNGLLEIKIGYETNGSRFDTILLSAKKNNDQWDVENSILSSPKHWFQPFTTPLTDEVVNGLAPGWDLIWNSLNKRGSLALRISPVDISTAHNRLSLTSQTSELSPCS